MIKRAEKAFGMKLLQRVRLRQFLSAILLLGVTFIAFWPSAARAAELVMFEQAGCVYCQAFHREITPVYAKTAEGARAPLRRLDIAQVLPSDIAFIQVERLTPLFVLVDNGREIGRIRGYPGEEHFWGLLGGLIKKMDGPRDERALGAEKTLHAVK